MLLASILASSMAFIDGSALNVSLPAVQTALGASAIQLLWIVSSYQLMLAAFIPVGGSLGDLLGRKNVFSIGIVLFTASSLVCGFSPSAPFLIIARVFQGAGGALMIPGSLSMITTHYDSTRRGRAIGTWSAVTTLVTVVGPILGGLLSNAGFWRGVFFINVPLGIATLLVLIPGVPADEPGKGARIDYAGAALLAVGLGAVTYGFISAPQAGFGSPAVIASLAAGTASLAAFIIVEAKSTHPMIPLGLFSSPTFSGANLLTLFLYGALSVGTFFLSLDIIQAQGYSMSAAGFTFLPFAFFLTVLSRLMGRLSDRRGPRLFLVAGPAVVGAGFFLLALTGLTAGPRDYWTAFLPGISLIGIGMGITVAPLTSAVMGSAAADRAGAASGVNNAVSRTAGVLAVAVLGAAALIAFEGALDGRAAALPIPAEARTALHAEAARLGAAEVPAPVPAAEAPQVKEAIRLSMVDSFRLVAVVSGVLCLLAAALAGALVEARPSARRGARRAEKKAEAES